MIHFDKEKWPRLFNDSEAWWEHKSSRPLIQLRMDGYKSSLPAPSCEYHHFTAHYPDTAGTKDIIESWDYQLDQQRFLGDAFPQIWPNYGPGVLAAFMGANLENTEDSVWFSPKEETALNGVTGKNCLQNGWYKKIKELVQAADHHYKGDVVIGMSDLGGALDVLASFRDTSTLLMDLYDNPKGVKSAIQEITRCWFKIYKEYHRTMASNRAYSAWAPILSKETFYMFQSDFCYMISPAMFDEFVKPELTESFSQVSRPFYHLDGPGELAHLDSLLEIESLRGVQWIPGDGQPDMSHWPEVYKKIREAGKLIQVFGFDCDRGVPLIDVLADQLGDVSNMVVMADLPREREEEGLRLLEKYQIPQ